jgi:hypothetical protein
MAIANDISIDYVNKIIQESPTASGVVHSVNALYSYLMDVFDELTQMDDKVPMSAQTPTSYTMINGWYIQEELIKYLSGGAVQTDGYDDEIHTLTLSSGTYVDCITGDVGKQVEDDSVAVGALLDYNNTDQKWWVRTGSSTPIANSSVVTISGGTGAGDALGNSVEGEHIFANPYTLGTLEGAPQLYIFQSGEKIDPDWWGTGHFDILIKVAESGVAIDSRKIVVFGRNWTDTCTVFEIILTTAGQNAIPLGNADDLNNQSTEGDVEDLQDGTTATIAINFSFAAPYSYDIKDGAGAQDYEVQIDCNNRRLSDVYEVCKFWLRAGSLKQLETGTDGTFMDGEEYRYANSSYSEVVPCSLGTYAGGKFFGARSIYFINLHGDDAQAFQLVDKAGTTRNPPNYQAFTINGVVIGDRGAIFLENGSGTVDKAQYNLDGANTTNKITVTATIPVDTPAAATIIVVDTDGTETSYAYTSWSGSDFIVTVGAAVHDGTETAYVPYIIGEASSTSMNETSTIYVSDRNVICIVRKKGILPFETTGTYSVTGYSATAIRTTDSVVT